MLTKNPYLIPVAILAGGIILALAVYFTRTGDVVALVAGDLSRIRPVSTEDHIVGNPQAPIVIVEYSDIDCEYCKTFQATMAQVMTEYGATGQVAWVYRHLPIASAHQYSPSHAEASECVGALGGNELFFRFIDTLNQTAPGGGQFDPAGYPSVVTSLGLSPSEFTACMENDTYLPRVTRDLENALALGAEGTPFSIILVAGKEPVPVTGAIPYEDMKKVIEDSLQKTTQ